MIKHVIFAILAYSTAVLADPPQIKDVSARQSGGAWTFSVTILHSDSGWDDYADGWRILDPNGKELGMRILAHPHVNERPFTRSLSGVVIPAGVTEVSVQTRDNRDGWSPRLTQFRLP